MFVFVIRRGLVLGLWLSFYRLDFMEISRGSTADGIGVNLNKGYSVDTL